MVTPCYKMKKVRPKNPNAPPISVHLAIQSATATTAIVVTATATIVKAAAEKKDYDENDNPR